MTQRAFNRSLQRSRIDGLAQLEKSRLVVVVRVRQVELEEARLHRRERHVAGNNALLCCRPESFHGHGCEFSNRLVLKYLPRRQIHTGLVRLRNDLNAQNGVTTELKKVF